MNKFEKIEIPSQIPNTKTFGIYKNGDLAWYEILPCDGYVLHNKSRDYEEIAPDSFDKKKVLGYGETPSSCPLNYSFVPVVVYDENGETYVGFGEYELFAKPKNN